jgi:uncharacterized protein (DUF952 family)
VVPIYKILRPDEWASFEAAGLFDGSPFDRESGFIHCSSREQIAGTLARYFADDPAVVIVALDAALLGPAIRWEESSDGELFPHVYGTLPRDAVVSTHRRDAPRPSIRSAPVRGELPHRA